MKYDVILLDADGTLFDYDLAEANALEKTYQYFNLNYDNQELNQYRIINSQIWRDFEEGRIDSKSLRTERFKRLFKDSKEAVDIEGFSKRYLTHLGEGDYLIDGAEAVCKYLYKKYQIIILTNGITDVQYSRINRSPLHKYIHKIITSEETGFKKPDIGIFDYTFHAIAHKDKGRTLIIGDSLSSDIQGGVNYQIDTCWYNPLGDENKTGLKPTYEIKDLKELMELL
ncbi:YjjG family noncanonical pyrimidine nucleotidase [Alkaliphilus transvaalensis]|uniref:YjjG family noncanonical pyrimidine nucleotidase n=1 Tax=Alkaliphilus transvaalensis TaxID=114628 RepID=UPI00047CED51|nr:YjjG family noncanonical pyrimidine nucleotidase [Alkaliphilus transvaalensis]